jgi:hypothetical protein
VNQLHAQPAELRQMAKAVRRQGLRLVGIHTPESDGERSEQNVARALRNWASPIRYCWTTKGELAALAAAVLAYRVPDRQTGRVRHKWEGELEYNQAGGEARLAALVDELLKEKG